MREPERIDGLIARQRRVWPGGAPPASQVAAGLAEAWRRAVGEQVAANSAPARMAGDTLVVSCSSSTWAGELALLEGPLLAALREAAGAAAPARLRFVVGELPAATADAPEARSSRPLPSPSPGERQIAAALASRLSDPDLRAAFERALAAALARGRSGREARGAGADWPL